MLRHLFETVPTVDLLPPPVVGQLTAEEFGDINQVIVPGESGYTYFRREGRTDNLIFEAGSVIAEILRPAMNRVFENETLRTRLEHFNLFGIRVRRVMAEPGRPRLDGQYVRWHTDADSIVGSNNLPTTYAVGHIRAAGDISGESIAAVLNIYNDNIDGDTGEKPLQIRDVTTYRPKPGQLVLQDTCNPHHSTFNDTGEVIDSTVISINAANPLISDQALKRRARLKIESLKRNRIEFFPRVRS